MDEYLVVDDLDFSVNKDKLYYVSSDTAGVYLKVSKGIYDLLQIMVDDIRSGKYKEWEKISDPILAKNYKGGFELLKKYNFAYKKGESIQKRAALETELIGTKVKVWEFNKNKKSIPLQILLIIMLILSLIILVCNMNNLISSDLSDVLVKSYQEYKSMKLSKMAIEGVFFIIISTLIGACVHESFHIMIANLFNVTVRSLSFYLLLGYKPVLFVKYRGLLKIEKRKRILIYLAGFIGNLVTANISVFLMAVYQKPVFGICAVMNIFMIIDNLSIIDNTDFYYVVTELFNKTNFKVSIIRTLSKVFNKQMSFKEFFFNKNNILEDVYLTVGILFRIASMYAFIYVVVGTLGNGIYTKSITLLLLGIYIVINARNYITNIKNASIS